VSAVAQSHQEAAHAPLHLGFTVEPATNAEEVGLSLLAGGRVVEAHRGPDLGLRLVWPLSSDIAVEGGPTRLQIVLVAQALVEHAEPDLTNALAEIAAVTGHFERRLPDWYRLGDLQQCRIGEAFPFGLATPAAAASQPHLLGSFNVLAHRWPTVAQLPSDSADLIAGVPMDEDLFDVCHSHAPSGHVPSLHTWTWASPW